MRKENFNSFQPVFDRLLGAGWVIPKNGVLGRLQVKSPVAGYTAMMLTQPKPRFVLIGKNGLKIISSADTPEHAHRIISHLKLVGII